MKYICGINERHEGTSRGRIPDGGPCHAEFPTWRQLADHINHAHRNQAGIEVDPALEDVREPLPEL